MASIRDLWVESYFDVPPFPCPHCDRGILQLQKNSLRIVETKPSRDAIASGDMLMEDGIYRYTQLLECAACGDVVAVIGRAALVPDPARVPEQPYTYQLFPMGFYPAPPLISLPSGIPDSLADELRASFGLFWVDLGACANKMRVSVEKALDELAVPEAPTLFRRIDAFKHVDPEHAESFDALRHVGNVGSHEGDNTRETILDAFEVYQDAIRNLFGGHRRHIDLLRKRIIASKGK
ncbi:DUF4145 domain-containing protein [Bradyrhizobium diazoefficiens]|uniref:DUF4145 domain-containing protein n=1 Tax=Bradyrhizobium diazoefficiens TaxID=1355477 RepID=UPI00190D3530|nr:DUF4145 domain-containing protein [Bradyrhizobium diazoefficiens]MBK3663493.1 DUF4145 domain-containing protein [Bradyrhizobium diazoefficiens]